MREEIAVGRMVKAASGKNIPGLADKLIPDLCPAEKGCGGRVEIAPAAPEKGEIDRQEYEDKKAVLTGSTGGAG